ncbi:hypothetical protein [Flexibacterium corallicola]|uniref:hypothetical protein n=1 Tax=Flexibacterium corallicola TaxID=3037259 RepID=UPI00286EF122|nr:hypothetical protein [Pseudovibrio sp. M1P-2-3]
MAKFARASTQARSVMKQLQHTHIKSLGTVRTYESALTQVASSSFVQKAKVSLRSFTVEGAEAYLKWRAQEVRQATLNQERLALQLMMRHVSHTLGKKGKLQVILSRVPTRQPSRSYSYKQVLLLTQAQRIRNRLATWLAYFGGRTTDPAAVQRVPT